MENEAAIINGDTSQVKLIQCHSLKKLLVGQQTQLACNNYLVP